MSNKSYCILCSSNNIFNEKRQLCKECYRKDYYARKTLKQKLKKLAKEMKVTENEAGNFVSTYGLLLPKFIINNKVFKYNNYPFLLRKLCCNSKSIEDFKEGCTVRYGTNFLKDVDDLNSKHFWCLTDVAEKYNLSKERIRQIFKKIYGTGYRPIHYKKKEELNADPLMQQNCHPKLKVAESKTKRQRKTNEIKLAFYDKCIEMGLNIDIACGWMSDFRVNGNFVKIHTSTSKNKQSHYVNFLLKKKSIDNNKYIILYHHVVDKYFFVPTSSLKTKQYNNKRRSVGIYIRKAPLNKPPRKNKYFEYLDKWEFLR